MKPAVIVPFRSLDDGKSRLACCLERQARRRLCIAMLERTLALVLPFSNVLVVSDDEAVRTIVSRVHPRAGFLHASQPGCLNLALDEARQRVGGSSGLLILPTDLVLLDEGALRGFVACARVLSIAPDGARDGTNLLLLPPAQAGSFRFSYGVGSFFRHAEDARRLGVEPRIVQSARTAFDLDTPADLEAFERTH